MKPKNSRSKFYTIHRDASEKLAPISRGNWVKIDRKPSNRNEYAVVERGKTEDNTNTTLSNSGSTKKVGLESSIDGVERDYLPEKNATSASRSRWFRGY